MKKIVFVPNPTRDPDLVYSRRAADLLTKNGFMVASEKALEKTLPIEGISFLGEEELYRDAHAMVVLGGDGSILRASDRAAAFDIPILAVNLGRLGYIAQLEKDDIDRLPAILSSAFKTETRSRLAVSLYRAGEYRMKNVPALNDAVISKADGHGMIELSLSYDGQPVSRYRADGLIFSTATGSTAYAMSAGGAVIDPALKIIEVTPICAHSLKARPIVFSGQAKLSVTIHDSRTASCLTLDGERTTGLSDKDRIEITLSGQDVKLISHSGGFCHILFRKMSDL